MIKEMYYWLMFFLRKIGKTEMFEFNSYLLICILLFANILSLLIIICYSLNIDIRMLLKDYKVAGFILAFSVLIPNYFILYRDHININKKYDQLSHKRKITGIILFWVYALVSLPLFFKLIDLV